MFESNLDHAWVPNKFMTPSKFQNCAKRGFHKTALCAGFFWPRQPVTSRKHDLSIASKSSFPGILGCFFNRLNFFNKRCLISPKRSVRSFSVHFCIIFAFLCLCLFVSVMFLGDGGASFGLAAEYVCGYRSHQGCITVTMDQRGIVGISIASTCSS